MNYPKIPTPQDEALRLAAMSTFTATGSMGAVGTNGNVCDEGSGFAPDLIGEPMALVLNVSAIKTTAGNETYTAVIQYSDDNATWVSGTPAITLTAVGNVATGFFAKHRYHQVLLTIGGTAPTITLEAFISPLVW